MTRSQKWLAGVFMTTGTLHFLRPKMYEAIMPDYLPAHRELVLASGAAEFACGAGVVLPATRRAAGWGLIATLIAIFPANLWMAQHPERYRKIPRPVLMGRLPLQGLFMWWAYAATLRRD